MTFTLACAALLRPPALACFFPHPPFRLMKAITTGIAPPPMVQRRRERHPTENSTVWCNAHENGTDLCVQETEMAERPATEFAVG